MTDWSAEETNNPLLTDDRNFYKVESGRRTSNVSSCASSVCRMAPGCCRARNFAGCGCSCRFARRAGGHAGGCSQKTAKNLAITMVDGCRCKRTDLATMLLERAFLPRFVGSSSSASPRSMPRSTGGRMLAPEVGNDKRTGRTFVTTDGRYLRPLEVEQLRADSTKIHREIGWTSKVDVADLARIMVRYDLAQTEYGRDDLVSDETIAQWRS